MKIVIDLQGAQGSNGERGIGRYALSLITTIVKINKSHEIHLLLNGFFCESVERIRKVFEGQVLPSHIHVWQPYGNIFGADPANKNSQKISERIWENLVSNLNPDVLLITSLFEGFADNTTGYVSRKASYKTIVVLYDLIPLIHKEIYLGNPVVSDWYYEKVECLRNADLLLSISESSASEAISYLNFKANHVVNISAACGDFFRPLTLTEDSGETLKARFGISRQFVMYTGGIDHRKNIESLIKAYSSISIDLRQQHQLVIVCAVQEASAKRLTQLGKQCNLMDDELILTGFVSDDEMLRLYNACRLFVFPSWHEGFGLPVLEAMACGKPVIASGVSSLPEVLNNKKAEFDPTDVEDIKNKIEECLRDPELLSEFSKHGLEQSKKFSWDSTARRALVALDNIGVKSEVDSDNLVSHERLRLAFFSPLPPARSGISDYSADLLRVLSQWYDIDLITDQNDISDNWLTSKFNLREIAYFKSNYIQYDRVLFHFGNSHFHDYMHELLSCYPGVVVLHDFFLSGFVSFEEISGKKPHYWTRELLRSHGYAAVKDRFGQSDAAKVIYEYPANYSVLNNAVGVVVHSEHSKDLAVDWYGEENPKDWAVVPLLKSLGDRNNRKDARSLLGLGDDDLLICSFGILSPTKLNREIFEAFVETNLAKNKTAVLTFVGFNPPSEFGLALERSIKDSPYSDRIKITGWVDDETYTNYLAASDLAVQVRNLSRGETSAAALDVLKFGIPTIINAHGSLSEIEDSAVYKLEDNFTVAELASVLDKLGTDAIARSKLAVGAVEYITTYHDPASCAEQYRNAIERMYKRNSAELNGTISTLFNEVELPENFGVLAKNLSCNFSPPFLNKQVLIDISELEFERESSRHYLECIKFLNKFDEYKKPGVVLRFIRWRQEHQYFEYADDYACKLMNIYSAWTEHVPIDISSEDILIGLSKPLTKSASWKAWRNAFCKTGKVVFVKFSDEFLSEYSGETQSHAISQNEDDGLLRDFSMEFGNSYEVMDPQVSLEKFIDRILNIVSSRN